MKLKHRKKKTATHGHWQAGNVIYIKPLKQECCWCHKLKLSGCHINGKTTWICNLCLKVRAKTINQGLFALPSFLDALPRLGTDDDCEPLAI